MIRGALFSFPLLALISAAHAQIPLFPAERTVQQSLGAITITVAVPSRDEADEAFGVDLYRYGVQPVWLEVRNDSSTPAWFLPASVDTDYFTTAEVLERLPSRARVRLESTDVLLDAGILNLRIDADETRSGIVFTQVDDGTKTFNVDVLQAHRLSSATFFVPVPGLRVDHYETDWQAIYSPEQIIEIGLAELAAYIETLPCCVRDRRDRGDGDPLNIALVGDPLEIYQGLMRAGWDETETIYGRSLFRTFWSALTGDSYRNSPVSALYVFGRPQDAAFQKIRTSIDERNHLRLWMTPMRYEGRAVWIGQISRDIGVRFARQTVTTHKIDPAVDETREFLLENLAYAQALAGFGYVTGVGPVPIDSPRGNLTGDPYFTDGLRAVYFFAPSPVAISGIESIDLGAWP